MRGDAVAHTTVIAVGSHHDALESYQKAVALAPSRLIHRVELGRTLHRLGKKEQARQQLEVMFAIVVIKWHLCLNVALVWSGSVILVSMAECYATSLV